MSVRLSQASGGHWVSPVESGRDSGPLPAQVLPALRETRGAMPQGSDGAVSTLRALLRPPQTRYGPMNGPREPSDSSCDSCQGQRCLIQSPPRSKGVLSSHRPRPALLVPGPVGSTPTAASCSPASREGGLPVVCPPRPPRFPRAWRSHRVGSPTLPAGRAHAPAGSGGLRRR